MDDPLDAQVDRVRDAFRAKVGADPVGTWAAPGRVNLIGDHTDYNDGYVLPIAIDRHAVVAIGLRDDDLIRAWSLQERDGRAFRPSEIARGHPDGWAAYVAGTAWALRRAGVDVGGFDLVLDGAVPPGSGLSSSAAIECATAIALAEMRGSELDRPALARAAQRAEVDIVGVPVGVMDQMASMCAREDHALFLDTRTLHVDHVPLDLARVDLVLFVIDTRSPRKLVAGGYARRRADCEEAARALGIRALRDAQLEDVERGSLNPRVRRRARHVITENQRVLEAVALLRRGRFAELGVLLTASHASLRHDYEVSTAELDSAVEASLDAGALGARMTGAGFGGCAIALVPQERAGDFRLSVAESFEAHSIPPDVFPVRAGTGARRVT